MDFNALAGLLGGCDRDGDGKITENDFIAIFHSLGLGVFGEGAARAAFRQFDSNNNGKIDITDALGILQQFQGMGGGAAAPQAGGFLGEATGFLNNFTGGQGFPGGLF